MLRWRVDTKNNIWLRRLFPTDIDSVAELSGRAFNSSSISDKIWTMLNIYTTSGAYCLRLDQQVTLVPVLYYLLVEDHPTGENLLGLTGLYYPLWAGKGVFWLGWFAVDPAFQGRGHGTRLLWSTMKLAAARGGRIMCIETEDSLDAALGLYHRLGFTRSGEILDYWAPGSNLLILRRSLDDIPIPQEIPDDL